MYPPNLSTAFTESPDLVLKVEAALEKCEETRGAALDILAQCGKIVLMGSVASEVAKSAAERVTRSVNGVTEVENLITVENMI